jgi:hypothetical protein
MNKNNNNGIDNAIKKALSLMFITLLLNCSLENLQRGFSALRSEFVGRTPTEVFYVRTTFHQ